MLYKKEIEVSNNLCVYVVVLTPNPLEPTSKQEVTSIGRSYLLHMPNIGEHFLSGVDISHKVKQRD